MTCPHCDSDDVERIGHLWVCRCCARAWLAFTRTDLVLLKVLGIAA